MSPDGSTKPSPEERLLKLIRGKSAANAAAPARPSLNTPSAVVLGGSGTAAGAQPLRWPVLAGGGLAFVIVFELAYLVMQMMRPLSPVEVPVLPQIPTTAPAGEAPPVIEVPSVASNLSRPLFVSSLAATPTGAPPEAAGPVGPSTTAKDLVTRLTLTGVIDGDPAQAIIEDTETKKTYFVTVGQPVTEGAVLESVQSNRAILNLNGEKITLSL